LVQEVDTRKLSLTEIKLIKERMITLQLLSQREYNEIRPSELFNESIKEFSNDEPFKSKFNGRTLSEMSDNDYNDIETVANLFLLTVQGITEQIIVNDDVIHMTNIMLKTYGRNVVNMTV